MFEIVRGVNYNCETYNVQWFVGTEAPRNLLTNIDGVSVEDIFLMIPKECKRLAEVDFPIAEVSRHAAREKSIRHGHPSTCICGGRAVPWRLLALYYWGFYCLTRAINIVQRLSRHRRGRPYSTCGAGRRGGRIL